MPRSYKEDEPSHEEVFPGVKLNIESWDPQHRTYLTRQVRVFALPELMRKYLTSEALFINLGLLGSKILVVPENDQGGISRRGQVYSTVIKCTYPLEFKEATIEISKNHETIRFIQEDTKTQELFTTHLVERQGIVFDLIPGETLIGGITTPSPLRVVLKYNP